MFRQNQILFAFYVNFSYESLIFFAEVCSGDYVEYYSTGSKNTHTNGQVVLRKIDVSMTKLKHFVLITINKAKQILVFVNV